MPRQRTTRDAATITVAIDARVNDALRAHAAGRRTKQRLAEDVLEQQLALAEQQPDLDATAHPADASVSMSATRSLAISRALDTAIERAQARWRGAGITLTKGELASRLLARGLASLPPLEPEPQNTKTMLKLDPDVAVALRAEAARRRTPGAPSVALRTLANDLLRAALLHPRDPDAE